jgi:lambda repressor-like predicted transcriptional regulator
LGNIPGMTATAKTHKRAARRHPGVAEGDALAFGTTAGPLAACMVEDHLDFDRIMAHLDLSKTQLAETAGLGQDSLQKASRRNSPKVRARITEVLEIINRIEPWAGGRRQALAWYRAQPIAALDGRTAEALVKSGKAAVVRDYLDHIALGGFA